MNILKAAASISLLLGLSAAIFAYVTARGLVDGIMRLADWSMRRLALVAPVPARTTLR
jgi:hypothetical protein